MTPFDNGSYASQLPYGVLGPPAPPSERWDAPLHRSMFPQLSPMQQLEMLKALGIDFARQDARWSWNHECAEQADGLVDFINSSNDWASQPVKYWKPNRIGGSSSSGLTGHNVVELIPVHGNQTTGSMVLDPFHGPGRDNLDRQCKCTTYAQFKKSYPRPENNRIWERLADSVREINQGGTWPPLIK